MYFRHAGFLVGYLAGEFNTAAAFGSLHFGQTLGLHCDAVRTRIPFRQTVVMADRVRTSSWAR